MALAAPVSPTSGDTPSPLRWTAFLFRLPSPSGRARTALWRALNALDAITLGQGTWAIPHRDGHSPNLERALGHIHAAGGEAWIHEVGTTDADDVRLQSRLQASCERLWDGFFNEADRVAFTAHDDPVAAALRLTELRRSYCRLLARDVLVSPAALRAERRLDDLAMIVATRRAEVPDEPDGPGARGGSVRKTGVERHTIGATTVVELADGRARAILCIEPGVGTDWERAFNDFERFAYAPDASRPPLRHNTFTVITSAADVDDECAALRRRIARFESFRSG